MGKKKQKIKLRSHVRTADLCGGQQHEDGPVEGIVSARAVAHHRYLH